MSCPWSWWSVTRMLQQVRPHDRFRLQGCQPCYGRSHWLSSDRYRCREYWICQRHKLHDTVVIQITNNRKIQYALSRFDVRNIRYPFLIRTVGLEISVEQIWVSVQIFAVVSVFFTTNTESRLYFCITRNKIIIIIAKNIKNICNTTKIYCEYCGGAREYVCCTGISECG